MMTATVNPRPLRVGIFKSSVEANRAVAELLALGFRPEQVTVICSEATVQNQFKQFEHQDPAGAHTPEAALTGGALGAAVGGVAALALASFVSLGGAALLAAGGVALWGGGVVGGLVGAMMTRGVEKELANYYDQAVERGQILVGVEQTDPAQVGMLAKASEIFERHGVEPLTMREG
jgi:hypothetical protein